MACELAAIVAVCDGWAIGYEGGLLVSNKADMRRFKELTWGCPVIMGHATQESFPGGRPLKGRRNIVLTRDASFEREGVTAVHSVDEALAAVSGEELAWVVGGAQVYAELLPWCTRVEVTRSYCSRTADAYFPDLDADPGWELVLDGPEEVVAPGQGDEGLRYRFQTYRRTDAGDAVGEAAGVRAGTGVRHGDAGTGAAGRRLR